MYLEPKITLKTSSLSPCIQIKLNQVRPANKIHLNIHFSEYFSVFLQIYCADMGVEHGLSSYITGASLSNDLSMKKILFLHGFFATGSISRAENTNSSILPSTPRLRSAWWFIRLSMETKPIG